MYNYLLHLFFNCLFIVMFQVPRSCLEASHIDGDVFFFYSEEKVIVKELLLSSLSWNSYVLRSRQCIPSIHWMDFMILVKRIILRLVLLSINEVQAIGSNKMDCFIWCSGNLAVLSLNVILKLIILNKIGSVAKFDFEEKFISKKVSRKTSRPK